MKYARKAVVFMFRSATEKLYLWKNDPNRKPLILRGARQVGKTWLMRDFGANAFPNVVYINFENNPTLRELFSTGTDPDRIITGLQLLSGQKIDATDTLIIFDEIQEVPDALSSLKYFSENAPQYAILCAGSLLGVALHSGTSFPVGKVEFLDIGPMSYSEFLRATGKDAYVELLKKRDFSMAYTFRQEYIDSLRQYYYVGGMPEAVLHFSESKDFTAVRAIQRRILDAYEQDFSKHAPADVVPRIRMLWNSIPAQLARENKKFLYGLVRQGSRAKDYEMAILWLIDCGLIHKVNRVTAPGLPLKAYEDLNAFKLFVLDVGLLSCMTRLRSETLLDGNDIFREFKGALTEQYVLQQLRSIDGIDPYYWTNDRGSSEVDFIVDNGKTIIPIEVKAEINLNAKSLKAYIEKYRPEIAIRTAMTDYRKEETLLNLPLWAIETMRDL